VPLDQHVAFLRRAAKAQEELALNLEREGYFEYAQRAWARANAIGARADAAGGRLERQRAEAAARRGAKPRGRRPRQRVRSG
jgi:hypothetical protein